MSLHKAPVVIILRSPCYSLYKHERSPKQGKAARIKSMRLRKILRHAASRQRYQRKVSQGNLSSLVETRSSATTRCKMASSRHERVIASKKDDGMHTLRHQLLYTVTIWVPICESPCHTSSTYLRLWHVVRVNDVAQTLAPWWTKMARPHLPESQICINLAQRVRFSKTSWIPNSLRHLVASCFPLSCCDRTTESLEALTFFGHLLPRWIHGRQRSWAMPFLPDSASSHIKRTPYRANAVDASYYLTSQIEND